MRMVKICEIGLVGRDTKKFYNEILFKWWRWRGLNPRLLQNPRKLLRA